MEQINRSSLAYLLCEVLQLEYQSEEYEDVFELCLRYCVNSIEYADFNKKLGQLVNFKKLPTTASKFRLVLRESGYAMSCIKFFILHQCKLGKSLDEDSSWKLAKKFKVHEEDADTIFWIMSRRGVRASIAKAPKVKAIKSDLVTPEAYGEMRDTFADMLGSLNKHAKVIVRKLSFIIRSENFDRDEFITDLVTHALKTHYYYSPNEASYEHHLNRLRAAMSNHRINMIKHYTTEGRQRMVNVGSDNGDNAVFVMRTSSESQLKLNNGEEEDNRTYDELQSVEQSLEIVARREFNMSIDQMLERILKCKSTKRSVRRRKARLLRIIVGRQVNSFDSWLRQKQLIKADTKTGIDFMEERTRDEYMPVLADYLKVSPDTIMRFLRKSANELAIDLR